MDFDLNGVLVWLREMFVWIWSQWQVKFLAGHICVNTMLAVGVTIRTKEFVLAKVPEFLYRKILPLTAVYVVFAVFGESINMEGIALVVWGVLVAALVGDTLDNLKKLGIERIPAALTKERLG